MSSWVCFVGAVHDVDTDWISFDPVSLSDAAPDKCTAQNNSRSETIRSDEIEFPLTCKVDDGGKTLLTFAQDSARYVRTVGWCFKRGRHFGVRVGGEEVAENRGVVDEERSCDDEKKGCRFEEGGYYDFIGDLCVFLHTDLKVTMRLLHSLADDRESYGGSSRTGAASTRENSLGISLQDENGLGSYIDIDTAV